MAHSAKLCDRASCHVVRELLSVPVGTVFDLGEAFAFDGLGQDHGWLTCRRIASCSHGFVDGFDVVAIDHDDARSECFGSATVGGLFSWPRRNVGQLLQRWLW